MRTSTSKKNVSSRTYLCHFDIYLQTLKQGGIIPPNAGVPHSLHEVGEPDPGVQSPRYRWLQGPFATALNPDLIIKVRSDKFRADFKQPLAEKCVLPRAATREAAA
jgi:hypothetical protein